MNNEASDYIEINRETWNKKTEVHLNSTFYDVESFIKGKSSLNRIELDLLGDVTGKSILHLQCHFGQDTISLGRMGAKVTGIDFSDEAIKAAKDLVNKANIDANFICCDIYDLPKYLDEKFDIVFTSYGTIGWLPDINKWAGIISRYLKQDGKFVFVEFHPFVWMFDDKFEKIEHNYFNVEPIIETYSGTYADKNSSIVQKTVGWNHSLDEVLSNLMKNGLSLDSFSEYDYSPYNCFNGMEESEPGKFRFAHLQNKIPLVYSLKCSRYEK